MKSKLVKPGILVFMFLFFIIMCSERKNEDYFPMEKGMKWEYSIEVLAPMYGSVEGKSICRVDGFEIINDQKYFKFIYVSSGIPGAESQTCFYRKEPDGLYVIYEEHIDLPEKILSLPFPIEKEKNWTSKVPIEDKLIEINYRIEGFETLEMIDKKYENCLKIVGIGKYQYMNLEETSYYANNIGPVKSIIKMGDVVIETKLEKFTR